MEVQQGGGRARAYGDALFLQGLVPSHVGAVTRGAADGGILVGDLAIQDHLSSGVIAGLFVSQQRDQALLQGSKAAFDFSFGLWAGGHQMGHAQGREGALELGTGVTIIGHGIMAKKAEAIGVDHQRQAVLEKETPKMLEVIPSRIGGDKDRAQKLSGMIIDGQEQGLLVSGRPPLVDGGIVLPKFAQARAFPAAARFGTWFRLADEVRKMRSNKGGNRLTMALETEADGQFIGRQLKVGRFLQWYKILEELAGLRWPLWPVAAAGEMSAELRTILYPSGT